MQDIQYAGNLFIQSDSGIEYLEFCLLIKMQELDNKALIKIVPAQHFWSKI